METTDGEVAAMEYFERKVPSTLPYYIVQHRRLAKIRFHHARSKEHALKHVDMRTGWLALFWILVYLAVMVILLLLLKDLIWTYFSRPVATQIFTDSAPLPFPDVTVCPISPISNLTMTDDERTEMDDLKARVKQTLEYAGLPTTADNVHSAMLIQIALEKGTLVSLYSRPYLRLVVFICVTFAIKWPGRGKGSTT